MREVVFVWVVVAGVFVPRYKLTIPGFAPVRNNLRLSGAGPHTVVDAERADLDRDGARDGVDGADQGTCDLGPLVELQKAGSG